MTEKSRKLTEGQKALMKEAAAEKCAREKEELEAALQGKSSKEQKIYKLKLQQKALKKRIAEINRAEKKVLGLLAERNNSIMAALGAAIMDHHKAMEKPDDVLRQLQIVADSLGDKSKKDRILKADINEGIAIIMKERQISQADASAESAEVSTPQSETQDGKEADLVDLNTPSDNKDESKASEAKAASPSRRKKSPGKVSKVQGCNHE